MKENRNLTTMTTIRKPEIKLNIKKKTKNNPLFYKLCSHRKNEKSKNLCQHLFFFLCNCFHFNRFRTATNIWLLNPLNKSSADLFRLETPHFWGMVQLLLTRLFKKNKRKKKKIYFLYHFFAFYIFFFFSNSTIHLQMWRQMCDTHVLSNVMKMKWHKKVATCFIFDSWNGLW